MNSDELRDAYLRFFEERGHKVLSSSSLIPHGDPTLLLTNAGMVQMKPYFTGQAKPPSRRMASCQKCFRTTDIDEVGDATHLTFFEMLGNFSVGDYFKKETITWAWQFVTQHLRLPLERLWVTIFLDDDEAHDIWRETGVPAERILRFDETENFWGPAGSSGPCGPDSEIHYDLGEEYGCGRPSCCPNCDCGRYTELWNLVFTQFDQAEDGSRTPLPAPNIDTGMGLERVATILQGKSTIYETDLFAPVIERVAGLAGRHYGADEQADRAIRVIADHGRAVTFLITDGVMPANEGRGYVLRRLLRRATLFGLRLGLNRPFLAEIARATVKRMGGAYPEIVERQDFVTRAIEIEEARFSDALKVGLDVLEGIIEGGDGQAVSGRDAFRLYDTYGLPVELTREVASERGLSVDMQGFEREMEAQRQRAKQAHKFDITADELDGLERQIGVLGTPFVGYDALRRDTRVIGLLKDGRAVDFISAGEEASVVLEATPFYGERGGQVGDTGEILAAAGRFEVTDTVTATPDIIAHRGHVAEGNISVGDDVTAGVDEERRLDIARNHTATHLLQAALRRVLGDEVQQRGSLVAPDRLRFDFSYLTAMMPEEVQQVQALVNEMVRCNLEVTAEEAPYAEAVEQGAIALFDEKYGDVVRVVRSGQPAVSAELCGGTHVGFTGEIGFFRVLSETSIGSGMRRIEAVTGRSAEEMVEQRLSGMERIARMVGGSPDEVEGKVSMLLSDLDGERKKTLSLGRDLARITAESLLGQAEAVNGVTVLAAAVRPFPQEIMREMADFLRERLKSAIIVLGAVQGERPFFLAAVTRDLVEKGYNAGNIAREVARVTGGGGGGSPTMAQAGGKDKGRLDEALRLVRKLV